MGSHAEQRNLTTFMHDSELKKLLLETCPVRPGQEARAWSALRDRLDRATPGAGSRWAWFQGPAWRGWAVAGLAVVLVPIFFQNLLFSGLRARALATADSQSPGIYATAFYSKSAQAQVVWLDGMDPATDKPTYLDPTSVIADKSEAAPPAGDPNSL